MAPDIWPSSTGLRFVFPNDLNQRADLQALLHDGRVSGIIVPERPAGRQSSTSPDRPMREHLAPGASSFQVANSHPTGTDVHTAHETGLPGLK
jgi:hypothetical protein